MAFAGGVAASPMIWPLNARAQQRARLKRLGILLLTKEEQALFDPLFRGLEALGYIDGKTIAIEYRDAEGKFERLPELANELVRLNPDVIFSFSGEQAPIVKKATSTIPIVVIVSNDPVASGIVASLGRPGETSPASPMSTTCWPEIQSSCSKIRYLRGTPTRCRFRG